MELWAQLGLRDLVAYRLTATHALHHKIAAAWLAPLQGVGSRAVMVYLRPQHQPATGSLVQGKRMA